MLRPTSSAFIYGFSVLLRRIDCYQRNSRGKMKGFPAIAHRVQTALDPFSAIPYLPASRRSDGGDDHTLPLPIPAEQDNEFTRYPLVDGSALGIDSGVGRVDSADQRSGFGGMDASERFDTTDDGVPNTTVGKRAPKAHSPFARRANLPTARATASFSPGAQ
jgi:hypothetical protein